MRTDIIDTIRKLLRRAEAADGHEAAAALQRAEEMMAKHKVHVTLAESRVVVPDVVGMTWAELLLYFVAKSYGCQVMKGQGRSAVVVGPENEPDKCVEFFRYLYVKLVTSCAAVFAEDVLFGGSSFEKIILGYFGSSIDKASALWFRSYLNAAVASISKHLRNEKKKSSKKQTKKPVDDKEEMQRLISDAKALAEDVGGAEAQRVASKAALFGDEIVKSIDWSLQRRVYLLKAAPPPPAPTRFNQIDIDEYVPPSSKTAVDDDGLFDDSFDDYDQDVDITAVQGSKLGAFLTAEQMARFRRRGR